MFKRFLFLLQTAAALILPVTAFAASPVPLVSPFAQRYQKFSDARNADEIPAPKTAYGEEERSTIVPKDDDKPVIPPQSSPTVPIAVPAQQFSAIETMYSTRAGQSLSQFGYDLFGVPVPETQASLDRLARNTSEMPMGAVQDDFMLQAGDELDITFSGQRTDHGVYKVNSQGLVVIPDMPPIPAEGRSIGQVRLSIQSAARNLHNTDAYVSLSSVRQIGVLVIGHVKRPGRQNLTVFNTILDALMESGGVDKEGSLRQVKLVRGGSAKLIDLYNILLHAGGNSDLQLRDGDRIIVPSIGPTVAVTGEVKRPGIFEILPREGNLSLADMLDLSGGVLVPGRNRFLNMEVTRSGHEKVSEIHEAAQQVFSDGSILMVAKGQEARAGTVDMEGDVRRPGLYALDETATLSKLLTSADILASDAYPLIGVIERRNQDTLTRELIPFPLRLVLKGEYDAQLQDNDKIDIFSDAQIRRLSQDTPKPVSQNAAVSKDDLLQDQEIASFLKERSVFVRGAVRSPGAYPIAEGVSLGSLLAVAGGATIEADPDNIEVSAAPGQQASGPTRRVASMRESGGVMLHAGDAVRVNQHYTRVEDKSVLVIGEVRNPGRYDLLPGDKVSSLIARAGGLTDDAYPDGSIFSRESERKADEARFRAQAREIQASIAGALEQDKDKVSAEQVAQARGLALELEQAQGVGRITVETDPYILQQHPEQDMLLESGDRLYIPKKSMTVRVSGEVLSPVTLQFRKDKDASDYIDEAGGLTRNADEDREFVVYPDGSAQPLETSWNSDDVFIPPGSTIIIPRDPEPFDFIQSAKDVSQILSNLAITALFIDDVRNDD